MLNEQTQTTIPENLKRELFSELYTKSEFLSTINLSMAPKQYWTGYIDALTKILKFLKLEDEYNELISSEDALDKFFLSKYDDDANQHPQKQ